ncbi:MAG: 4'-phosphopantetheinyl transferase superfamily protein [Thermosynechococcaceae cyanobacterium]
MADCYALLSPEEQARTNRYLVDSARRQFAVGRGLLRCLLGRYLQQDPRTIPLSYSDRGKPQLMADPPVLLQFNVSHSQDWVVYAVSAHHPVGIDTEWINPQLDYRPIAQRILSDSDWGRFKILPVHQQPVAFFKIWSRMEAVIKLCGQGLFKGLETCGVPIAVHTEGQWTDAPDTSVWVQDLAIRDSFATAIALPEPPQQIETYEWPWTSSQ